VFQLFIGFKKAYDSVRREVLYNIIIEFDFPMKLIRLITMCMTDTYSRACVHKYLSDMIIIRKGLKQGDDLSSLLFNSALGNAIRSIQVNQNGMKLKGTHQYLVYTDDVNALGGGIHTIKKTQKL
jgi:hypothetical protein